MFKKNSKRKLQKGKLLQTGIQSLKADKRPVTQYFKLSQDKVRRKP
jgi:hypothetical protein